VLFRSRSLLFLFFSPSSMRSKRLWRVCGLLVHLLGDLWVSRGRIRCLASILDLRCYLASALTSNTEHLHRSTQHLHSSGRHPTADNISKVDKRVTQSLVMQGWNTMILRYHGRCTEAATNHSSIHDHGSSAQLQPHPRRHPKAFLDINNTPIQRLNSNLFPA
jgi:hypothetical protein